MKKPRLLESDTYLEDECVKGDYVYLLNDKEGFWAEVSDPVENQSIFYGIIQSKLKLTKKYNLKDIIIFQRYNIFSYIRFTKESEDQIGANTHVSHLA